MDLFIVATTSNGCDDDGETWHNGPFTAKAEAYAWASKMADQFVKDNPLVQRSWLEADGDSLVYVEEPGQGFIFEAMVVPLNPPF